MNLLLALFLIITEAVFEGLKTAGYYIASELIEFVYLIGVTLMAFAWLNKKYIFKEIRADRFIMVLIGYFLLRFAIFDSVWSLAAGQDLFYYGETKWYDQVMTTLGSWGWLLKGIAGVWGLAWLVGWRNGIKEIFIKIKGKLC